MELIVKNTSNAVSLVFLLLFSTQLSAVTVNDAIKARQNNKPAEAVKILTQLANSGNNIAQYNLAVHYSQGLGVAQNEFVANEWSKDATRTGLVEAYLNLNSEAIKPANGASLTFLISPAKWLSKQEPNKYTIQLASSRYEKSIKKKFEEHNLKGKGGYYHYTRDGVDRYALIYGVYPTVAEANVAMKKLPDELQKQTPWVRKIKSLQKISK